LVLSPRRVSFFVDDRANLLIPHI